MFRKAVSTIEGFVLLLVPYLHPSKLGYTVSKQTLYFRTSLQSTYLLCSSWYQPAAYSRLDGFIRYVNRSSGTLCYQLTFYPQVNVFMIRFGYSFDTTALCKC